MCNIRHKRGIHEMPYLLEIEIQFLQNDIRVYNISMDKNSS